MEDERRRYARGLLRTELWIGQDGIFTRTDEYVKELGVGGAFIQSSRGYPVGTVFSFRFRLPGVTNFVSCSGIVRSLTPGEGYGVEFLDLARENARIIERLIDEQAAPVHTF